MMPRVLPLAAFCLLAALASGCEGGEPTASAPKASASVPVLPPSFKGRALYTGPYRTPKGMHGLTILGHNYTDSYIDSFTVNGAGGGNLEVSDEGSGGGGGTCCAPISGDVPLPMPVEIAWRRDGDDAPWCKQTVLLDGPVPSDPYGLQVRFFQDGTIELAIVDSPSTEPKVKLGRYSPAFRKETGNVNNDTKFSECKHGRYP